MAKKTNYTINGVDYYRKYVTINGKRKMVYGESVKDWQAKVDELKRLESLGVIDSKKSVGEAMHTWVYTVLAAKQGIRENTFAMYERVYRSMIKGAPIMSLPLIDIKSVSIQSYANKLQAADKSITDIKKSTMLLGMFFKYAVSEGYILKNPCTGVSLAPAEKPAEIEVFSDGEIKKILAALDGSRDRFLFVLALSTGMRLGELLALRHSDLAGSEIYVSKQQQIIRYISYGNPIEYEVADVAPKTATGLRHMPLTDKVRAEYLLHKKICQNENLSLGRGRLKEEDCIFLSVTGKRRQPSGIQKAWREVLAVAGVPYKKIHTLRHTYITKLIQNGVPIATVMQLAGHSNIATTLRYTHVEMSHKEKAVEVINSFFV